MAGETGTLTRRFSLASLVAMAFAAFVLTCVPNADAQEVRDAHCEGEGEPSHHQAGGNERFAQTFVVLNTGTLTRAQVQILKFEEGSDFVLAIHNVDASGTPSQTPLASDVIPDDTVGLDVQIIEGFFTVPVVAGQQYALAISRPGPSQSFFSWEAQGDIAAEDPCPGGTFFFSPSSSDPFTNSSMGGQLDLLFAVFVTLPAADASTDSHLTCKGEQATHVGTPNGELIEGTDGPDVIVALGGNDKVFAGDGDDLICGNRGKDLLRGQGGEDKLFGARGKDRLFGAAAADLLVGGAKGDSLFGGAGKDKLRGGSPNAPGKDARDLCRGGAANDKLKNCER